MDWIVNLLISGISGGIISAICFFMSIKKYKEKIDRLERHRDIINTKEDRIMKDIANIRGQIGAKESSLKGLNEDVIKLLEESGYRKIPHTSGPLTLTEIGQKIVTDSGFVSIFEIIKDDLCAKLLELTPTTKYDVQEKARDLMDGLIKYDPFKPLHIYAFKEGKDVGQILRAGSILLRDYFLQKHPEIKD